MAEELAVIPDDDVYSALPDYSPHDLDLPLLCSVSKVVDHSASKVLVRLRGVFKEFELERQVEKGREPKIGDRYLLVIRREGAEGGLLDQGQALEMVREGTRRCYRRARFYVVVAWAGGVALGFSIARLLEVLHG